MTFLKKIRRVYLDHAAATPVDSDVVKVMAPFWSDVFGNPSSIHQEGVAAKKALAEARKSIAGELGVLVDEIIFTGSATESCNLALIGVVRAWKEDHKGQTPHVIVSAIEHDAVLGAARALQKEGVVLTFIPVNGEGIVDVAELSRAITKETVIISVGYANNEIGVVQPLQEIARAVRNWKKEVRGVQRDIRTEGDDVYPLLHTDACQATNYLDLKVPQLGVDLLTINAAKIYGPKGVGLLAVRRGIPISPIVLGGGHERGVRAGTENIPLIVGFAEALRITSNKRAAESTRLLLLRDHAIGEIKKIPDIVLNGSLTARLPNNVHFSLRGADHEFVLFQFDAKGIAVSTKSACNEADAEHSHVLEALSPASHGGISSGIRVTLGRSTTKKDIDVFLLALQDIHKNLIVTPR